MSAIIHVRHSAPVRYVPRRGNKEREVEAELTTPVTLRAVSLTDLGPPAVELSYFAVQGRNLRQYHAFEGGYWQDISGLTQSPRVSLWHLTEHLAGTFRFGLRDLAHPIRDAFQGTAVPAGEADQRGVPFDAAKARRVTEDYREEWQGHLRDFLDRNVVVAGTRVFVRVPGPLAHRDRSVHHPRYRLDTSPRTTQSAIKDHVRPDRIQEHLDHVLREDGFEPAIADLDHDLRRFDPALLGDDDLLLFVNRAPVNVEHALERRAAALVDDADYAAFAAGRLTELRPWRLRGRIGAIGREQAEGVLRLLKDTMVEMDARLPRELAWQDAPGTDHIANYIDEIVLPRLVDPAPTEEDAAAFDGLDVRP